MLYKRDLCISASAVRTRAPSERMDYPSMCSLFRAFSFSFFVHFLFSFSFSRARYVILFFESAAWRLLLARAVDIAAKKHRSGKIETIFVRNQVERMIFPTMKSTTSAAMAAVRDPTKKQGHRLAGGERGPLSRCLFAIQPFFTVTRQPLSKGCICEAIVVAIGRVRA